MNTHEGADILSKLGILNSNEESPNKMKTTRLDGRRSRSSQRRQRASSLSDDSEDEIVFDRNALLNARKRRRRRRSSSRSTSDLNSIPESKRCKITCLFLTFLLMGMSTAYLAFKRPKVVYETASEQLSDYSSILTYGGLGYLIGTYLLSLIFTRLNAFIALFLLVVALICLTGFLVYSTSVSTIILLFTLQQMVYGAMEKGGFLMVHGIFKGNTKLFFMLIAAYSLGAGIGGTVAQDRVFWASAKNDQSLRVKRELMPVFNFENSTLPFLEVATRPHSAVGIETDENPKTQENQERRKDIEDKKNKEIATKLLEDKEKLKNNLPLTKAAENTIKNRTESSDETVEKTSKKPSTTTTVAATKTTSATKLVTQAMEKKEKMLNFSRSRNRLATDPPSIFSNMKEKVEENVLQLSDLQYMVAPLFMPVYSILAFITVAAFVVGFCACCLRFQCIADVRIAQLDLDVNSYPEDTWLVTFLSVWSTGFQAIPEFLLINGLPALIHNYINDVTVEQGMLFCSSFWFASFLARLFFVWRDDLAISVKTLKLYYLIGFPTVLLTFPLYTPSEATVFAGLMAIAIFVLPLPLITSLWAHTKLKNSPSITTLRYFLAMSSIRLSAPSLAIRADSFAIGSTIALSMVLSVLLIVFMVNIVERIGKERKIDQLTGELNGQPRVSIGAHYTPKTKKNGKYDMLMADESDADVEMDVVFQNENSESSDSD
ncbi:unnamed protein product [Bursaphelenchus okinawaensis]|uniref:Uncharacterized protein n=1 Tax=Bursaphelenchus okinawaensis TaxID=465554 RepID=A0A811L0N7_9BILA|nr:unnamed protein product [Bursaphelenchus okinawaensis]CAG9114621.1 unnamed protein product [Bursaphelenchus okinawaensis]